MRSRTRPSPRIERTVPVVKRGPDPKRSASHLSFVRSLPCAVCGKAPSEACHIRKGTDGGMATKPSDRWCIPMCAEHHRQQHQAGEVEFFGSLGVDPYGLADELWRHSGDVDRGHRAALRTSMQVTTRRMAG